MAERDAEFVEYVTARAPSLRRVAYLMCQDWHLADDLVQTAVTKLYVHWPRVRKVESLDGYVHTILVNTCLAERRSPWRRKVTLHGETISPREAVTEADTSVDLRTALAAVPPRQRAAIVLRYYCDLSVDETATVLRCSPGTVKSQTARGLAALRRLLDSHPVTL
jgi:RNA polymerase sigma-70 factor (sigma-E family)